MYRLNFEIFIYYEKSYLKNSLSYSVFFMYKGFLAPAMPSVWGPSDNKALESGAAENRETLQSDEKENEENKNQANTEKCVTSKTKWLI